MQKIYKKTTQLPTTIDIDDHTAISCMTPNHYNYKRKTNRVDTYIISFSRDRKLLTPNSQQKLKSHTSNSKNYSEEESEEKNLTYRKYTIRFLNRKTRKWWMNHTYYRRKTT